LKRSIFQAVSPVCPACRREKNQELPLQLHAELVSTEDEVEQGILLCPGCMREFPIIDGIPIIVSDVRTFIRSSAIQIHWRDDLPDALNALLGDCCGSGSPYELTRYYLSTYGWGHYHDLDPSEPGTEPPALVQALDLLLSSAGPIPSGLVLDLGCSVGRSTFHLAEKTGSPVLGLDLNFSMLRMARRAARGEVLYSLRRGGLVYTRRQFPVRFPAADRVDFWAADATCLPLRAGRFSAVSSLNLLDVVSSPYDHLAEIGRILAPDGRAWVGCPYDWSPTATDPVYWLGGHSQRSGEEGSSPAMLKALMTPGALPHSLPHFRLLAELSGVPWTVRLHDRSQMIYDLHVLIASAHSEPHTPG
jgi:SAM-dependent methyltransferase/uncharacterized protein YbaR (Trm112 family)